MARTNDLTAETLKQWVKYDEQTGVFTWAENPPMRHARALRRAGKVATQKKPDGYLVFSLLGVKYKAHRLAWLYMTGQWPRWQIDPINGVRDDNALRNLRDVPQASNLQNGKERNKKVKTPRGVFLDPKSGLFRASISLKGKTQYLGVFTTAEEASRVYLASKRANHPGCLI